MPRPTLLPTASALLLAVACAAPDRSVTEPVAAKAPRLARAGASTPLAVTVADVGPDAAWRGIRSDGQGPYVDAQRGVSAVIDGYGNLQVGVPATTAPARKLVFDFGSPAAGAATVTHPDEADQQGWKLTTNPNASGLPTAPRISDLAVGGRACYSAVVAHRHTNVRYEAWFNTDHDAQSVRVLIERTGAGSWTLVSDDPRCGANAGWAGLYTQDLTTRKAAPLVGRGYYGLPFAMQLQAL